MNDYRAFSIGEDGRFVSSRAFHCSTDEDAIEWAKQLFKDQAVELRRGGEVIARLAHNGV